MPKATVNEDYLAVTGEDEIGGTGQILTIKPKAVAETVGNLTNDMFRAGVLAPDSRHTA